MCLMIEPGLSREGTIDFQYMIFMGTDSLLLPI